MTEESWVIEWSQRQGQFHIVSTRTIGVIPEGWLEIGKIWGTYEDASRFASKWLKDHPEAKKAYDKAVHF